MTLDQAKAIIAKSDTYFEIRNASPVRAIIDGNWIDLQEMEAMLILMRAESSAGAPQS